MNFVLKDLINVGEYIDVDALGDYLNGQVWVVNRDHVDEYYLGTLIYFNGQECVVVVDGAGPLGNDYCLNLSVSFGFDVYALYSFVD